MDIEKIVITDEVRDAINGELAYQESLSSNNCRADKVDHGLSGQLVTLDVYVDKAKKAWAGKAGNEPSLHELRKVAAIAIRALVRFGCPTRGE